jgi:hypothetical protein
MYELAAAVLPFIQKHAQQVSAEAAAAGEGSG